MIFSNSVTRRVAFSKIGDVFSGGWTRTPTPPPIKGFELTKIEVQAGPKSAGSSKHDFDQDFVDKKVSGFEGPGHVSGKRQPGDTPDADTPDSPEITQYREANRKKWQAEQDAKARDKLFDQPTPGRVDGREAEPFSQSGLEDNAEVVVKAKTAKANRALPLEARNIAKTAAITTAITAPITATATLAANVVLERLKPKINPAQTPATEQHVMESRLVDNAQRNVFLLANTLGSLRSEEGVKPSVEWLAKTNDERMDYLDEMLDYLEKEFAVEANSRGIQTQPPSIGAQEEDIKSRATGMESRMAYINGLLSAIKPKV